MVRRRSTPIETYYTTHKEQGSLSTFIVAASEGMLVGAYNIGESEISSLWGHWCDIRGHGLTDALRGRPKRLYWLFFLPSLCYVFFLTQGSNGLRTQNHLLSFRV